MLTMRVLPIGRHRLLLVVGRGCPAASAKVAGFASSASGDVTIRAGEQQKRLSVPSKFSPVLERIDRPKSNNFLEIVEMADGELGVKHGDEITPVYWMGDTAEYRRKKIAEWEKKGMWNTVANKPYHFQWAPGNAERRYMWNMYYQMQFNPDGYTIWHVWSAPNVVPIFQKFVCVFGATIGIAQAFLLIKYW